MKIMKNISPIIILTLLTFACGGSSSSDGVKITGKVENPIDGEQVVLNEFSQTGLVPVDTIEVLPSGEFTFYVPVNAPTLMRVM